MKATCIICGKEYDACLSCKDKISLRPWKTVTDTIDCYKLFLILAQFNKGSLTKDVAKKQLSNIKYNLDELKEHDKKVVLEIMSETTKKSKTE